MKKLRPKLTYSNVVSTLCLLLLVGGGTAYAAAQLGKNTVGSKQLKKNSVTAAKVKNGSLGAADIGGPVNAALSASMAIDSASLGGSPASSYRDSCPTGTRLAGGKLCVETRPKGTWLEGLGTCAELGLRYPSLSEALLLGSSAGEGSFWTDDYFSDSGTEYAVIYEPEEASIHFTEIGSAHRAVCVMTPTNS